MNRIRLSSIACGLVFASLLDSGAVRAQDLRFGGPVETYRGRGGVRPGLQGGGVGFSFCRLAYQQVMRERGGSGWDTDFPNADNNLMFRAEELTTIGMAKHPNGEFAYSVVLATHPDLYRCPFLFASDVGTMGLTDSEVASLQNYLEKGGFLWVDDFWGTRAWVRFESLLKRIVPDAQVVELTPEHPMMSAMYNVQRIPQIPSWNQWRRMGRSGTSERGLDSETPHMRAVYDMHGRMVVLITYNTDIADGWEREGTDEEYFYLFSPEAYAIAVNVLVWVMTH